MLALNSSNDTTPSSEVSNSFNAFRRSFDVLAKNMNEWLVCFHSLPLFGWSCLEVYAGTGEHLLDRLTIRQNLKQNLTLKKHNKNDATISRCQLQLTNPCKSNVLVCRWNVSAALPLFMAPHENVTLRGVDHDVFDIAYSPQTPCEGLKGSNPSNLRTAAPVVTDFTCWHHDSNFCKNQLSESTSWTKFNRKMPIMAYNE